MTRAFVTGIGGQDGSYLAERLLAEGVEVHALAHEQDPPPEAPGVELHTGDLTRVDDVRALLLDLAPDEVYNLAAISSVARSWDQPDLTALVNGTAAVALMESALQVQDKSGRQVRFVQASSAEIFGQPEVTPQDETTPIRPVNPYGAAKAYAHLSADVYRRRDLHAVSAILYNHESPRRPTTFVTRKITSTVAAIAQGRSRAALPRQPRREARLGLGPRLRRRPGAGRPGRRAHATSSSPPGVSHSVRDFAAAAFHHAGIDDWEGLVDTDPALVRPADPTELTGDASRARRELGWAPTVGFEELVGRMVDADLAI